MPGACNRTGVVYQATVTSEGGRDIQTCVGLGKNFKSRFSKHKASMTKPTPKNSTTLSTHFLKQKNGGHNPEISWKFLESNVPTFNPVTGSCRLCLREKYHISFYPEMSTLNSRSEIFSSCRHKRSVLLAPPDPNSQGGWDQDQQLNISANPLMCLVKPFPYYFVQFVSVWRLENTTPWNTV